MAKRCLLTNALAAAVALALVSEAFVTYAPASERDWSGSGLTAADGDTVVITAESNGTLTVPAGAAVTVAGGTADAPVAGGANRLTLDIGAGARVVWRAHISFDTDNYVYNLITVTGGGTFELDGGSVTTGVTGARAVRAEGTVTVNVKGGTVRTGNVSAIVAGANAEVNVSGGLVTGASSNTGNGAIYGEAGSLVTVSGGVVENRADNIAVNNYAINTAGSVIIEGGTVKTDNTSAASSSRAIRADGADAAVTVRGGLVSALRNNIAIESRTAGSVIAIEGGVVSAEAGLAVSAAGTLVISGGAVFANGGAITDVINRIPDEIGSGAVIAYNDNGDAPQTAYVSGETRNLVSLPAGSAAWSFSKGGAANSQNGIVIQIPGVAVGKAPGADVGGQPAVSVDEPPTSDGITVAAVTIPSNPGGQSVEYALAEDGQTPADGWQPGPAFTGLLPDTLYYIFARSAENGDYHAGTAQRGEGMTAPTPASTPAPTSTPTATPTSMPTATPTAAPTSTPTATPSTAPTPATTPTPTSTPVHIPSPPSAPPPSSPTPSTAPTPTPPLSVLHVYIITRGGGAFAYTLPAALPYSSPARLTAAGDGGVLVFEAASAPKAGSGSQAARTGGYKTLGNAAVFADAGKTDAPLRIIIPHAFGPRETPAIRARYISRGGAVIDMTGVYDAQTGCITFTPAR